MIAPDCRWENTLVFFSADNGGPGDPETEDFGVRLLPNRCRNFSSSEQFSM